MRALVTGASGMLGARLARLLLARGAHVRVSYRPGDRLDGLADLDVEHRPVELPGGDGLEAAMEGVEVAFHVAALVSFDLRRYAEQMRVNVEGTRRVLEAARTAGVRRFVLTSTVNTLGVPPPGTLGDERTPFDWAPYRLGYMDSKKAAEDLVLQAAREGFPAVCVLPGTMFGPGDINENAASYIRLVDRSPVVLALPGGTTVCHVDDVAEGHLLAADGGRIGERYVLGGEPMSYRDLFRRIARALGRSARVVTLPPALLRGLGVLADRGRAIHLPLPFSRGLARAAASRLYYASDKAERELGWRSRPAEAAILDAVTWYQRI